LSEPLSIRTAILEMAAARGDAKTFCPSEIARQIGGSDEKRWRLLMSPIRTEAVRLADEGAIVLLRKGRPVDPHDFKGIYRIRLPKG